MAASSEKKDKLSDAYQALQYNHIVDDLLTWIEEVENQLSSEDHGKDLASVKNLLKKHQVKYLNELLRIVKSVVFRETFSWVVFVGCTVCLFVTDFVGVCIFNVFTISKIYTTVFSIDL